MRTYENDGFVEYYGNFLKSMIDMERYIDPDAIGSKTCYYYDLTNFLNAREEAFVKAKIFKLEDKYIYYPPTEMGNDESLKIDNIYKQDKNKIMVRCGDESEPIFLLTSDQLGFSAKENIYIDMNEKYPLCRLLNLVRQKKEPDEINSTISDIATYVCKTRSLGGGFIWPINSVIDRKCSYNIKRGTRSYIQDRVDLTLLEVKKFYTIYDEYKEDTDVIFKVNKKLNESGCILSDISNKSIFKQMFQWLVHFKSFKNYIDYFMLDDFVEINGNEYIPINIITGKKFENIYSTYNDSDEYNRIESLSEDELKQMLKIVENGIVFRTNKMISIVSPQ